LHVISLNNQLKYFLTYNNFIYLSKIIFGEKDSRLENNVVIYDIEEACQREMHIPTSCHIEKIFAKREM